jgi:outer membrane immunogenic protein
MRKSLLSIAAVAALFGTPAFAADMALKAPPLPPAPIWSGWYFGANGGGGWENTTWTFPTVQFFATAAGQSFSTNPNGGIAGGQFGYNYQFGHWVVGGEFMGDWSGLSQKVVGPVPAFPFDSYTTKLSDLESLTLRFGYAPANWLFYGKAGIATGSVNLSAISGVPVAGVAFSNTQRQWGPTVGVGPRVPVDAALRRRGRVRFYGSWRGISHIDSDVHGRCTLRCHSDACFNEQRHLQHLNGDRTSEL